MNAREEALFAAHMEEAARRGAEIYNLGWSQTDTGVASKTSLGILDSEIGEDGKVTHQWLQPRH